MGAKKAIQDKNISKEQDSDTASIAVLTDMVRSLSEKMDAMDKLFRRRFDEISMEVNATAQQMDMAEGETRRQFSDILETLGAISYHGDGSSPVNTGVELEAVIEDTEEAANTILDAADRIAEAIQSNEDWTNETSREAALDKIKQDVQEILLACTFQDLTGQRIRNTLESLHMIENRLSGTLNRLGIEVHTDPLAIDRRTAKGQLVSQQDIDALFKQAEGK